VFGETHTSRALVAHTGNAAKPSPGIDIIGGSASVRMFDDSRIAAMLSPNPRGQQPNNFRLPQIIAKPMKSQQSNQTHCDADAYIWIHAGFLQTQFYQRTTLRKQTLRKQE
jgi:hypothetical protein